MLLAVRRPGAGVLWWPLLPRSWRVLRRRMLCRRVLLHRLMLHRLPLLSRCTLRLPFHSPGFTGVFTLFRPDLRTAADRRTPM